MLTFKLLKTNGTFRLVTPDGRSHVMTQDKEKKHMFEVGVPDQALVPSNPDDAMSTMFETIKRQIGGENLPYLLEFLVNNREVRLLYVARDLGNILKSPQSRKALLVFMKQYGALNQTTMGGYKRSAALDAWLEVRADLYMVEPKPNYPAMTFDQAMKSKAKTENRVLPYSELIGESLDFLLDYKERMFKKLTKKGQQQIASLILLRREELRKEQPLDKQLDYEPIDRTKKK